MRIFIIGMPGAGKTHFGRVLSKSLGFQFKDIDEIIEKQVQMSIKQFVEQEGEEIFRKLENEALLNTIHLKRVVIACGGGTPVYFDNLNWMKKNGLVVWLDTDLKQIYARIRQNSTRRPMFLGLSEDDLRLKLKELYDFRKKFYTKADIIVNKHASKSMVLSAVIQRVMKFSKNLRK